MVSKPNFVLGMKQKSLTSKEDSHVHITVRSHTCLSARSRLHSISQPPWLTTVSRSSSPSNPCLSLSDLHKSKPRLTKPTPQTCSPAHRDQNPGTRPPTAAARATTRGQWLIELSRAAADCQHRGQISVTRAANKALSSTDLLGLKNWWSYDAARATTRHLGFRLLLHAPVSIKRA